MRISYSEDEDYPGQHSLWQANCRRSLAGVKGQAALRDLEAALLALPEKRLIADHIAKGGEVCAVGAIVAHREMSLGRAREIVLKEMEGDPSEEEWDESDEEGTTEEIGVNAGIPRLVAWRLAALNDIDYAVCAPEQRYENVLAWTRARLAPAGGLGVVSEPPEGP